MYRRSYRRTGTPLRGHRDVAPSAQDGTLDLLEVKLDLDPGMLVWTPRETWAVDEGVLRLR